MATKTKENQHKQIAIYPDVDLRKKIEIEAGKQHRGLGPTVLQIVRVYFAGYLSTVPPKLAQTLRDVFGASEEQVKAVIAKLQ